VALSDLLWRIFPMLSRSIVALALLVAIPAAAHAQRGGRDTKEAKAATPKPKPQVRYPTVRDIEDHNPASLLVDKRKKLSLADSTVAQLKALEKANKAHNVETLAMYDSVRRRINSSLAQDDTEATPGLQMENQRNKLGLRNLFGELSDRRKKDAQDALALVPESSKKAAADLLTDQGDDLDRLMPRGRAGSEGPPGDR
jgi:hypothetical protein